MSIFLSPSSERNFCFLLDKSKIKAVSELPEAEKVEVWVSKGYLAVVSPVFKTMLYGDSQGESNVRGPIYLPGKDDENFLEFLDCLFPYPTQKEIDDSNVDKILRLADEYKVGILLAKCDEYYVKTIENWRRDCLGILKEYLPILLKYKLNVAIKALVPYAATMGVEELVLYRSMNPLEVNGYHQFFSAVFEAKLRRVSYEEHSWSRGYDDQSKSAFYICKKCQYRLPEKASIDPEKCHQNKCFTMGKNNCICGYDFDSEFLDL